VKSRRFPEPAVYVLEKMAHGFKRLGRAGGAGFYDYADDSEPQLWSGLKTFERGARRVPDLDVRDRLVYAAAVEALKATGDGDAVDASSAGAAPQEIAAHAARLRDGIAPQRFLERARELAGQYGLRFEPPASASAGVSSGRSA
jgi:3-hydroxyacyl-CoA dehydrogenase / enoyl-CoA hydratase / 3-hydroxybutyryl-CoA epimerase